MPHVLISTKMCTGCHMCELACSAYHEGAYQPSLARLNVIVNPTTGEIRSETCAQTTCHKCLDSCPRRAIYSRGGVVYVNQAKCDGCVNLAAGPSCILVCPFDVIHLHPITGRAFKCDLCDGDPQCIAFCQNPHVMAMRQKADKADSAAAARDGLEEG